MTNLKEQTFAVLAEKPNSIAHNWFQQAFSKTINWVPGNWYVFDPTAGKVIISDDETWVAFCYPQGFKEAEFEKRLEQEKLSTNKKEISQDDIKRAQYYLECFTKKMDPKYEFAEDYSDLKDKGKIEMLVNDVYNIMVKNKDVESKWGDYHQKLIEKMDIDKIKPIMGNSRSTGENAQTFPKNTVFGKENIALKPTLELKGDGNIKLDGFDQKQVTFTYQTAIDLLSYYTKIDKGIIKIEMP